MKILALETATEACSVALSIDGVITEAFELAPRMHAKLVLPMCERLLADAGLVLSHLDALAFGCGPGSFTGLRIAAGVIQGLALGADLPIASVSTLAALAQQIFIRQETDCAFAALDARMGEVYWGVYQRDKKGLADLFGEEMVIPASQVIYPVGRLGVGVGNGWQSYQTELTQRLGEQLIGIQHEYYPRAAEVCRLAVRQAMEGHLLPAEQALPVYLRNQVARKPA